MSVRPSNNRLSPLIVIRPINTLLCGQNPLPLLVVMLIALSTFLCGRHCLWGGPLWQTIFACVLSDPHRPHSPVYFQTVPTRLWSGPLWQTILACALQPLVVGFDMAHVEVMQKLPEEVGKWFCVENTCEKTHPSE